MYVAGNPSPPPASMAGALSTEAVQRASMNTALAGSAGGLSALLCAALLWRESPLPPLLRRRGRRARGAPPGSSACKLMS
jgi:hypothetical protein